MPDHPIRFDRTVNLNTFISIFGVAATIIGLIVGGTLVYSRLQAQSDAWTDFQHRQEGYNTKLDTDRTAARATYDVKIGDLLSTLTKIASITDQQTYQIAQLQKKDDETDARLGRMTESYGDKFTEIQTTLAGINTQLALQSQVLTELKQIVATITARPVPPPR